MFAFVLIYKLTNPIPFVFFSNKKVEILRGAQGGENGLKKVCVWGGLSLRSRDGTRLSVARPRELKFPLAPAGLDSRNVPPWELGEDAWRAGYL